MQHRYGQNGGQPDRNYQRPALDSNRGYSHARPAMDNRDHREYRPQGEFRDFREPGNYRGHGGPGGFRGYGVPSGFRGNSGNEGSNGFGRGGGNGVRGGYGGYRGQNGNMGPRDNREFRPREQRDFREQRDHRDFREPIMPNDYMGHDDRREPSEYREFVHPEELKEEEVPLTPEEATERDMAILKDLDLWEEDGLGEDKTELLFKEDVPAELNPMEVSWRPEKERSRELEKRKLIEINFDELISHSPKRKAESSEETPAPAKNDRKKKSIVERDSSPDRDTGSYEEISKSRGEKASKRSSKVSKEKMENLRRLTGGNGGSYFKRANSESTKPSLDMIFSKDFDSKESFSRRFKVIDGLGEGGSSIVRKVICRKDGKTCAVKSCKSNDSSNTMYIRREKKVLDMLSHPNIITPYEIFESTSNVGGL